MVRALYVSASFTDHCALIISLELPKNVEKSKAPKSFPHFKIKPYVLKDAIFKHKLKIAVDEWISVTDKGTSFLECWPGTAKKRSNTKDLAV